MTGEKYRGMNWIRAAKRAETEFDLRVTKVAECCKVGVDCAEFGRISFGKSS